MIDFVIFIKRDRIDQYDPQKKRSLSALVFFFFFICLKGQELNVNLRCVKTRFANIFFSFLESVSFYFKTPSYSFRNGVKPNNHRRSNTQTISTTIPNGYELPDVTDTRSSPTTNRPNTTSTNNNRTRPPISRPAQLYRGSQTTFSNANNNPKVQSTPSGLQKPAKKSTVDLGSTFTAKQLTSNDNGFLNDVSNRPLSTPNRSQMATQRRTPTQSSVDKIQPSSSIDMTTPTLTNGQASIPRSSSSLSQGRKSGIPTIGKQQRPSIPTTTR